MATLALAGQDLESRDLEEPYSRVETVVDTLHGIAVPDDYRWLEDQESAETRRWIDAQNAYTRSVLEPLPLLPALDARLAELMRIDRVGRLAHQRGDRYFLWKKRADDDLWILYWRQGLDGDDEALIDPHGFSIDHSANAELLDISRDGRRVAYGVRGGGEDEIEVRILEVDTGLDLPDRLPPGLYTGVEFTDAGRAFVYGRHDRESGGRIYRHTIDSASQEDVLLFGEGFGPEHWISPLVSDDGLSLVIAVYTGWSKSEIYWKDLAADGPVRTVVKELNAMFEPHFAGNQLLLLTDWRAPRRRLLAVDEGRFEPEAWREIVGEGDDPIEDVSPAAGRIFVHRLHDVQSRIESYSLEGIPLGAVALPGPGVATVPTGAWKSTNAFFSFQSITIPRTVFRLDVATGETATWGRDAVPFDGNEYVEKQIWFSSKDGTRVPMFVVHGRDLGRDGGRPTLLYGYGGFNLSQLPYFGATVAAWLEMGGVYAMANLRGGGEFGEDWHRAGMLENKQNVFDDFIAAAQWLIDNDYTDPEHLAIWGGSNGGLLVGAALTQRPDLFRAVLCEYPDLDMLRYYQFPNLNTPALAEYGDASDPEQFAFLYDYSPYQRVENGRAYPAVLLTTGDADTRVPPLQARKMTARLQAATSSGLPVMLLYDTAAGHSGGKPLSKRIQDDALKLAFLAWQLGLEPDPRVSPFSE